MKTKNYHDEEWVMIPKALLQEMNEKIDFLMSHTQNKESCESKTLNGWIPEEEAQKLLRRGTTWLYNKRRAGELRYTTSGNQVLYNLESIYDFLKRNERSAA